tara:strand:- start:5501 stop:6121 length:621 start_codon:yes stop_codon:yes gene_type:complete
MIGTGDLGRALGPAFSNLGHEVIYGSRNPNRPEIQQLVRETGNGASATGQSEAAAQADIVMLAVPWNAVEGLMTTLGSLSGKIVIDPTNPRMVGVDGLRDYAVSPSNAEWIQRWAPDSKVVKAFNTMNWVTMVNPQSAGGSVSVPIVGDDSEAKAMVASLVEGVGLHPIDLGPLRYASVIEGMYIVWGNARTLGRPFNYFFRPQEN